MTIVQVAPQSLIPHPEYERYHTPETPGSATYERIKASIVLNGIRTPLVVQSPTHIVLCGHKRLAVACELGLETVPVTFEALDEETGIDRMVEDNLSRAFTEPNPIKLAAVMARTRDMFGLSATRPITGWHESGPKTDEEIAAMFRITHRRLYEYLRLLRLIEPIATSISLRRISIHGGSILAGYSHEVQRAFWTAYADGRGKVQDDMIKAFCDIWDLAETRKTLQERVPDSLASPRAVIHQDDAPNSELSRSGDPALTADADELASLSRTTDGQDDTCIDASLPTPVFLNESDQRNFEVSIFYQKMSRHIKIIERLDRELREVMSAQIRFQAFDALVRSHAQVKVQEYLKILEALLRHVRALEEEQLASPAVNTK